MSTTPSEAAASLALELARVLESIHDHFALPADIAGRLAATADLGPARQHMADAWHIADATEGVTAMLPDVEPPSGGMSARARFGDNICDVIEARLFGARRTGVAIR